MSKKITCCASAVIAAMFAVQPAFAQSTPTVADKAAAQAKDAVRAAESGAEATAAAAAQAGSQSMNKDQMFVQKAAQGGMYEVAAARIAQERGQGAEVKELAKMIEQDHQKANQQLMQLAQSKNIQVPQQLDTLHQAKLAELQKMQGQDFDKHYLRDQVAGHVAMSLKFRDAAKDLQDPELKQYAMTTRQAINQHGQHAARAAGWTGFDANEAQPASATERGSGAAPATPGHSGASHSTPAKSGAGSTDATSGQKNEDRGPVGPSSPGDATTPR